MYIINHLIPCGDTYYSDYEKTIWIGSKPPTQAILKTIKRGLYSYSVGAGSQKIEMIQCEISDDGMITKKEKVPLEYGDNFTIFTDELTQFIDNARTAAEIYGDKPAKNLAWEVEDTTENGKQLVLIIETGIGTHNNEGLEYNEQTQQWQLIKHYKGRAPITPEKARETLMGWAMMGCWE